MPTKKEREYYAMGFRDGIKLGKARTGQEYLESKPELLTRKSRIKKISAWQAFVKNNSKKKKFRFANGKLKLKTMGIAYRKTAAYKRNKKK